MGRLCACGCGRETSRVETSCAKRGLVRGEYRRYVHGHHMRRGQPASRWNGGLHKTVKGYRIHRETRRFEHVEVVERALGKRLRAGAVVHHVNGLRADNRPENLVACDSHSYHMLLHRRQEALDACGHADWRRCHYCHQYGPDVVAVPNGRSPRHAHLACRRAASRRN